MDLVGFAGIAFPPTGRIALQLQNGAWVTLSASQGERLMRHRAEEGLPPLPVLDPPDELPPDPPRTMGERRRHAALPPSVIAEPLVLWRGAEASVACERVIPYTDGFEVELRLRGLADDKAKMPWGVSSRGFWHFAGLHVTVSYSDGRSQRIDDLTGGDLDGPVTVSPFRRGDASLETLWLWVMPLPDDGHVHLAVTWADRHIEQAAVDFAVTP